MFGTGLNSARLYLLLYTTRKKKNRHIKPTFTFCLYIKEIVFFREDCVRYKDFVRENDNPQIQLGFVLVGMIITKIKLQ